ncbi:MAG: uroporphyrinogen decarboxylase family protein [Planctomycetota bacterium]
MNYRERVIRTVQFKEVDELPFRHAYGLMPGVLEDWHKQGLPASVKTEKDIYEYFGFPTRSKQLPVNVLFDPLFEENIIEETDEYRIARDFMGRTTKVIWTCSTLPVAIDWAVKDEDSWLEFKRRLRFKSSRMGNNLKKVAAENVVTGHLNTFGVMGFYWFPRDLMGDELLCISYYEKPEWIHDILETWCSIIEQVLTAALVQIKLDVIHFGEDVAYKTASMVSKPVFDEFIKPYYARIYKIIQKYKVPVFSVDSDGCLNELIFWFADCGVNYIGPNEVNAGNNIVEYRGQFGNKMAYDGGLNKLTLKQGRDAIDKMLENTIPFMKETGGGWSVCLDHRVVEGTRLDDFKYYVACARKMIRF